MKPEYFDKISKDLVLQQVRRKLQNLPNMRAIRKYMEDCVSDILMNEILK